MGSSIRFLLPTGMAIQICFLYFQYIKESLLVAVNLHGGKDLISSWVSQLHSHQILNLNKRQDLL